MSDNNPNKWLTLDESIAEDIGNSPELQAKFDESGERIRVALNVYQLRNSYRLTKENFAKIVGLTAGQVTKIERANFTEPPSEVFEVICKRMDQWLERIGSSPRPSSDSRLCAMALKTNQG
ncbi:MAG: helix-turn-helix transcriptional regulator [Pseudomonadota bacterium]